MLMPGTVVRESLSASWLAVIRQAFMQNKVNRRGQVAPQTSAEVAGMFGVPAENDAVLSQGSPSTSGSPEYPQVDYMRAIGYGLAASGCSTTAPKRD